jgi:nicotinate-nucleotide adenylyltransferase
VPALGILGGSFNPPHAGHIALARDAQAELGLDRVLLMPLHTPPHKPGGKDPGPEHRLAMTRLAAAGEPGVEVIPLEIERGGPSYTADTLKQIHDSEPEADLTFIVGADTALTLPDWRRPGTVLSLARLAVASRPGSDRGQVLDMLGRVPLEMGPNGVPREQPEIVFLAMGPVEASSTAARARIAAGEPLDGLLDPAVARYIAEHGLYRGGAER